VGTDVGHTLWGKSGLAFRALALFRGVCDARL